MRRNSRTRQIFNDDNSQTSQSINSTLNPPELPLDPKDVSSKELFRISSNPLMVKKKWDVLGVDGGQTYNGNPSPQPLQQPMPDKPQNLFEWNRQKINFSMPPVVFFHLLANSVKARENLALFETLKAKTNAQEIQRLKAILEAKTATVEKLERILNEEKEKGKEEPKEETIEEKREILMDLRKQLSEIMQLNIRKEIEKNSFLHMNAQGSRGKSPKAEGLSQQLGRKEEKNSEENEGVQRETKQEEGNRILKGDGRSRSNEESKTKDENDQISPERKEVKENRREPEPLSIILERSEIEGSLLDNTVLGMRNLGETGTRREQTQEFLGANYEHKNILGKFELSPYQGLSTKEMGKEFQSKEAGPNFVVSEFKGEDFVANTHSNGVEGQAVATQGTFLLSNNQHQHNSSPGHGYFGTHPAIIQTNETKPISSGSSFNSGPNPGFAFPQTFPGIPPLAYQSTSYESPSYLNVLGASQTHSNHPQSNPQIFNTQNQAILPFPGGIEAQPRRSQDISSFPSPGSHKRASSVASSDGDLQREAMSSYRRSEVPSEVPSSMADWSVQQIIAHFAHKQTDPQDPCFPPSEPS